MKTEARPNQLTFGGRVILDAKPREWSVARFSGHDADFLRQLNATGRLAFSAECAVASQRPLVGRAILRTGLVADMAY